MIKPVRYNRLESATILLTSVVIAALLIAALYWGQTVLMPFAMAIFLTFLLAPIVTRLERWKMGRIPAVCITTTAAMLIVIAFVWLVVNQVTSLLSDLPNYSGNIKAKLDWVRTLTSSDTATRLDKMFVELNITGAPGADTKVMSDPDPLWVRMAPWLFQPLLTTLGQGSLVIVLVVFMLLKREDLRNRFIRLLGRGRMTTTTKAVDDASQRISRFLLMQLFVNASYGLALALGLALIRVDYALLWGIIAAVMRYIPYIGAPTAALLPITLSLAQWESWWPALLVVALIIVLELVSNNVMEPWMYGRSIGVSEVAFLVAAAFWAFLWGAVGLVLSGPLTVCLVVLGKYVPQLEFLSVLLGDEPALPEEVMLYQRLAAKDEDEAARIVDAAAEARPAEEVYDTLLLPVLNFATRDRQRKLLDEDDERFIHNATREIMEDVAEKQAALLPASIVAVKPADPAANVPETVKRARILGVPARDRADEMALEMLRQLLDPAKFELHIASFEELTGELVDLIEEERPALICIASLPPGGLAHTRYLCKRLRARCPKLHIVVGRWGQPEEAEDLAAVRAAGANHVETTLPGMRHHLNGWLPALRERAAENEASATRREPVGMGIA